MVLDTSAIVAILLNEPERRRFDRLIEKDSIRLLSAATLVEVALVIEGRKGDGGRIELDNFMWKAAITIVPVTAEHAEVAREAFRRYGKGRHKAALNFGDCFSYALAKSSGEPLLFKGADFAATDIESAA